MAFDGFLHPDPKRPDTSDAEARLAALHRQAGALVHDFNNLLTVILNANEALAAQLPQGSTGRELAEAAQAAAERGAELVGRLLDLSQDPAQGPVDCAEAVAATARRARLAAPRSVTVEVRLTDAPLMGAVDGAGLESALLNLCVNASHAMPAGGVMTLTAQARTLDAACAQGLALAAGRYIVVTVSDTGVGMSQEVLARATEPFFSTRCGRGGTGLGLCGARDFVEAAGGRLVLASREGHGTTASLYLPHA
ncbi:ATP-binding protein [Phenylobacterium sp.]|uniref:sensor histidine kinase n=1 Tax=Phenylobacterium sp. TaxID=1871053 RepID=UPI0025F94DEB|nr:ATP-binding protein [Phenylobacterium sp.]